VLESSSNAEQRAIAAQFMGYVHSSAAQINALVRASHDPEEDVRNNATRALWVLAASSPKRAERIPADGFIEMLYSRSWTDRNKSSLLLEVLTRSRDPKLLAQLRSRGNWMETPSLPRIEIEYCTQCVPGAGGVFDVRVEGKRIWSRQEAGRFPDIKELKQLVRDRVSPEKDLGHSDR
jgi:selenoprotein W-related protein